MSRKGADNFGNYYTWCAATAGCKNESGGNPTAGVDAVSSICPKGWVLPSGGSTTSQFYILTNGLNYNTIKAVPYNFIPAGWIEYTGTLGAPGSHLTYWSRTASTDTNAYYLYSDTVNYLPGTGTYGRFRGYSVRCVAEQASIKTITKMQEMTAEVCDNSTIGDSKRLLDDRAGQKLYWVSKLPNGKCWMTQDLDLDLTNITLTSADSDVTKDTPMNISAALWTPPSGSYGILAYADLGSYFYTAPTSVKSCTSTSNLGVNTCLNNGWKSASGMTASDDADFYTKNKSTYVGSVYDAHYLAGNYYSFNAAAANTGTTATTTNSEAPSSICPKGWKLPNKSDFDSLVSVMTSSNMRINPYFFIDTGAGYDSAIHAGSGRYWSSTSQNGQSTAYILNMGTSVSVGSYYRYNGMAVRCTAR